MTSTPAEHVVTIFRSRLRPDAEANGYYELAAVIQRRAREMPGFVAYKAFVADDGERVSIAEFDSEEHHNAWRDDQAHHDAQGRGRREFYTEYSVQICRQTRARTFTAQPESAI